MLTDKKFKDFKYYQPIPYHDDGTNIEWGELPEELYSFQAFRTREECERWLENNGYEPDDFNIAEYVGDDIEGVTLIDEDGDAITRIEDLFDDELQDLITDEVLLCAGSIDNLHATRQSDETEDQFKDRVYTEALDHVNAAIKSIEDSGDYNFQAFLGCPETEWYDEARDEAVRTVMNWMLEDYPY